MFDYVLQKAEKFFEFFVLGTIPNQTCKNHLIEIWKHYRKKSIWAQQILDSMTKVPVGLLTAHGIVAGNMEECLEVTVNEDFGNFTGKHCLVNFQLPTGKYGPGSSKVAQYRWGICMPSTCSANDLLHLLKYGLHLPAHFDELDCRTLNDERPFQPREIFALCVIALLLLLVTLSTIYDRITSSGNKNGFFIAFSLIRNFKTMIETKSPPGTFPVIHGFRFYATVMVILSHTYMMCAAGMRPINLFKYETWLSDWDHVWLTSRGFMLNTFFVLSGFFISFLFLKDRDKGINFNIYLYWIHRILRIGPVLYMMLLFTSTLTNRLSSAPRWLAYSRNLEESCKQNWWEYVLFINTWWGNLECMEHAWYVSVDIQLYFLSPILLIPLHRWPKIGLGLSVGTIIIATLGSFTSSYVLKEQGNLLKNTYRQERNLYELPFHRITPWVSGIIFGYFVYKKKKETPNSENGHREKTAREKCVKWAIGHGLLLIPISLIAGLMLAVHPFLQPDYVYNRLQTSLYLASSYFITSVIVTSFLAINFSGYGGIINLILSSRLFIPLSRLSYSIYMIHFMIANAWFMTLRSTDYLGDIELLWSWIAITMYSILFAPIMFLMVELPFSIIDREIQNKVKSEDTITKSLVKTSKEACMYLSMNEEGSGSGSIVNGVFELSEVPLHENSPAIM